MIEISATLQLNSIQVAYHSWTITNTLPCETEQRKKFGWTLQQLTCILVRR